MKDANVVLLVILVLLIGAALQLVHYYPLMPDRMATHFGSSTAANGWSAKQSFFTMYALIELGMVIILIAPVFLQRRIPVSMINVPHREFWFAADRREETWLAVSKFTLGMTALTLAFLIAAAESVFRANLGGAAVPTLGSAFFWALGLYLAAVGIGTIQFYRRFSRVPRDANAPPPPE